VCARRSPAKVSGYQATAALELALEITRLIETSKTSATSLPAL
jgi:hypothetical protein